MVLRSAQAPVYPPAPPCLRVYQSAVAEDAWRWGPVYLQVVRLVLHRSITQTARLPDLVVRRERPAVPGWQSAAWTAMRAPAWRAPGARQSPARMRLAVWKMQDGCDVGRCEGNQ